MLTLNERIRRKSLTTSPTYVVIPLLTELAQELPAFQKELEASMDRIKPLEHRAFHRAAEYALHANKMNAELLLHRVLRGWLTFHMATTVVMLSLAALHIFLVLFY